MKKSIQHRTLVLFLFAFFAAQTPAAEDAALLKDLTSVIALLAVPCGQVVSAKMLKDNDHIATCKDGNRYRVYVNAEGRVVAEKK
ncbi:MAG: hypothetical protein LH481_09700 [Burkholderiales bacterium]|nr:hypothetical protein [Burkholderiales bacterium]